MDEARSRALLDRILRSPEADDTCQEFSDEDWAAYADAEAAGHDADELYPRLGRHFRECESCLAEYREFGRFAGAEVEETVAALPLAEPFDLSFLGRTPDVGTRRHQTAPRETWRKAYGLLRDFVEVRWPEEQFSLETACRLVFGPEGGWASIVESRPPEASLTPSFALAVTEPGERMSVRLVVAFARVVADVLLPELLKRWGRQAVKALSVGEVRDILSGEATMRQLSVLSRRYFGRAGSSEFTQFITQLSDDQLLVEMLRSLILENQ